MSAVPSQPPPAHPYWSFLICSASNARAVNIYLNGRSLGSLIDLKWVPQTLPPNSRPVTLRDIADPQPFESLAEMKLVLQAIVETIEVAEPVKGVP